MNPILIYRKALAILSSSEKKKSRWIIAGMLITAILDVFSIAALIPIVAILLSPDFLVRQKFFADLLAISGMSAKVFTIVAAALVFLLFVIKNLVAYYILRNQSRFAYSLAADLSSRLYQRFFYEKITTLKERQSSDYYKQIVIAPAAFANDILLPIFLILSETLILLLILTGGTVYNPVSFGGVGLLIGLGVVFFYSRKRKLFAGINVYLSEKYPQALQSVVNAYRGFVDIVLSDNEDKFNNRFRKLNHDLAEKYAGLHTAQSTSMRILEIMLVGGLTFLFIYSSLFIDTDQALVLLTVFAASAYRVIPSVNRIFNGWMQIKTHLYALEELEKENILKRDQDEDRLIEFNSLIELQDVAFSYRESNFSLQEINLRVEKGRSIGLTGKSGSGKTTLSYLLMRFLIEEQGRLIVDGKVLGKEIQRGWQKNFGYVSQEPFLFDGSLISNITMSDSVSPKEFKRITKILHEVGLGDWLKNLPDSINTRVGEGGAMVSIGQKQRIAIARSLYQKKNILVLDEITSNLDQENKSGIIQLIRSLQNINQTFIIISHDPGLLDICDSVIQLQDGRTIKSVSRKEIYLS